MLVRLLLLAGLVALAPSSTAQVPVFDPSWGRAGPFASAETCASCHSATPEGQAPAIMRAPVAADPATPHPFGADISPLKGVRASLLGHSMDDPYFHAVVEDEVAKFPDHSGPIEDKCLRCHAPMGHHLAHEVDPTRLDGDGFYRMAQALTEGHAREGVSCTVCHQAEVPLGVEVANGAFTIRADNTLTGPYPDPVGGFMAGYAIGYDEGLSQGRFCGACHNLFTDVLDVDTGQPTGERFLEQATFFEWRNSAYGGPPGDPGNTTCQDCHMRKPTPEYVTRIASVRREQQRDAYSPHLFVGGNTHALSLLGQFREELGLDPRLTEADFEPAIEATRAMLSEAARLDVAAASVAGGLDVDVTITNLTGHKLPSGFPSRRMWLQLTVRDESGTVLFESGTPDARGRLASDAVQAADACTIDPRPPTFDNEYCYTPHYDVIENPEQVAVYESVMGDTNGEVTVVLLNARDYLKDNRLPPAGFLEAGPDFVAQTASAGVAEDPDFNAGGSGADTVHYRIITDHVGPVRVEANLLYQSIRPQFVTGMHSSGARVTQFKAQYEAVPPPAELIAAAILDADVSAPLAPQEIFQSSFEIEL